MVTLVAGQSGTLLDLYVKAGTVLYSPVPPPTFVVKNASSLTQGSGLSPSYYGHLLSDGHYDARNFTVPSSGGTGTWTITWSILGSTKIEEFTVETPTLSELGASINDIELLRRNIRIDIGDIYSTIFTDYLLNLYIEKSIIRLNRALGIGICIRPTGITPGGIGQPATVPSIMGSIIEGTLYPNTDEIKDLVVLQAEVLITRAEMSTLRRATSSSALAGGAEMWASGNLTSSSEGISVQNADGVKISTESRGTTWLTNKVKLFLDEAKTRELELAKAIQDTNISFAASFGKVVY